MQRKKYESSKSPSQTKNRSRSRSHRRSHSRDHHDRKYDSYSRSNNNDAKYKNSSTPQFVKNFTYDRVENKDLRPAHMGFTSMNMGYPSSVGNMNPSGPKPNFYDRRNRNPHEMYKKLGGTVTLEDLTGILQIDWKKLDMPKIRKNFYKKSSSDQSHEQVKKYFKDNEITIRNHQSDMPDPIMTFDSNIFPEYIVKELKKAGFARPTPIQSVCWPIALAGMDVIAIAQTGSGKTLGFLMPLFVHITDQPLIKDGEGPIGLILAPTRELALQIEEEVVKFGVKSKLRSLCCFGGVDKWKQKTELQRGIDLIISTPGRLIDFLEMGVTNLFRVSYLVLDEADRMLDMGFEPQIRKIISQIRPDRQTLMLSATWPKEVQSLARDFIKDPIHVQIGSLEISLNSNIKQHIEIVEERHKLPELLKILKTHTIPTGSKVLIFCQTKKGCEKLSKMLKYEGFENLSLHGDKSQKERDYAMDRFRNGKLPIVVATDLAARGLDVKDIAMVINYDFPMNIEDYVHRIGRTGRGGALGVSYALFTKDNERLVNELIKILEETDQHVSEKLRQVSKSYVSNKRKPNFHNNNGPQRFPPGQGYKAQYNNNYNKNPLQNNMTQQSSNSYGGYNNYSNNNTYRPEPKPYEKLPDYSTPLDKPTELVAIKLSDHKDYAANVAANEMLKINNTTTAAAPSNYDYNSVYFSQTLYNPQAYNYLANMWSNYQQQVSFDHLQGLTTNTANTQIIKPPEETAIFNNTTNIPPVYIGNPNVPATNNSAINYEINEIQHTNNLNNVVENPSSS